MKTHLTAWVAVDGNGQAFLYQREPRFDAKYVYFIPAESEDVQFFHLGECAPLAGQCWRVEIPEKRSKRA